MATGGNTVSRKDIKTIVDCGLRKKREKNQKRGKESGERITHNTIIHLIYIIMNSEGVSAAAREVRVRIARRRPPRVLLPQGFWLTLFYKKK